MNKFQWYRKYIKGGYWVHYVTLKHGWKRVSESAYNDWQGFSSENWAK